MGKGKFILSKLYITLFIGFSFVVLFTMTYTQGAAEGTLLTIYEVTIRQFMFAAFGFMMLLLATMGGEIVLDWKNQMEPDPLDMERGWLIWGLIAMAGARFLAAITTSVPLSSLGFISGTIALTSAVFEEPIFCAIGLLFYSILLKLFKGNEGFAIIGSTLIVAVLFAIIHIGVYGLSWGVMLYLMVGRIVYNLVFLKTRTLLAPTVAHLGHNFLIAFLGV